MNEYIKRDDALKIIFDVKRFSTGQTDNVSEIVECISLLKAEDVVPVVRCKDCEFMEEHIGYGDLGESAYTCMNNMEGWILPESYCSNGRRLRTR